MEDGIHYPTRKGVPQGGIISPTISNMVLDGLEETVRCAVQRRCRINFVRHADDFIITGKSKSILEDSIQPVVEGFLRERGLELSSEKTVVTHIKDGFTFLGQTFRKHGRVLHITLSNEGVHALMQKVKELIRKHVSAPMPVLIKKLNDTLRGWANYHRHVVASEAFSRIDTYVFEQLRRMLRRRHPTKNVEWADPALLVGSRKEYICRICEDRQVWKETLPGHASQRNRDSKIREDQSGCQSLSAGICRVFLVSSAQKGEQAAAGHVCPRISGHGRGIGG